MRELNLKIVVSKKAAYKQIADALRQAIQAGQLRQGEKLPSTRTMAKSFQVHRHTIMAALNELVAEGWITSHMRQAYRVNEDLPSGYFESAQISVGATARRAHKWRLVRSAAAKAPPPDMSGVKHTFKSGTADLRLFPYKDFKSCLDDTMRSSRPGAFSYGDPAGHPLLVESIKTYLRRVRSITDREVVITNGSQEGIFLAAQLLVNPGDKVAVERLGYQPAWQAIRAAGGELVPVEIDSKGMVPDSFAGILRRHRIRMLYMTPLHQYPTTSTLPIARRLRIYELAAQAGVPILEDDYDHEFHYRSHPLPPLASMDSEGLVIYVSTFSKILFPSARVGFLSIPRKLATPLAAYRRIVSRQNTGIIQDAVARWMNAGGFERHLRKMRRTYAERLSALNEILEEGKAKGLPLSWSVPDGGMAVWVDTGMEADTVAKLALQNGVFVHPGTDFQLCPESSTHLRVGFAGQTPQEIKEGMRILFHAIAGLK